MPPVTGVGADYTDVSITALPVLSSHTVLVSYRMSVMWTPLLPGGCPALEAAVWVPLVSAGLLSSGGRPALEAAVNIPLLPVGLLLSRGCPVYITAVMGALLEGVRVRTGS